MDIESWNVVKTAVFIAIPETSDMYNFLTVTIMEVHKNKVNQVLTGEYMLEKRNNCYTWANG